MTPPFSTIGLPRWDDYAVYVIGGGTSLRDADIERIKRKGLTIGVNKSAWWFGTDVLFSLDQTFVRRCRQQVVEFVENGGEAFFALPANDETHKPIHMDGVTYVMSARNPGVSDKPNYIFGVNSGYGAIGLAYLKGARWIGLLGMDMQYGPDGSSHVHDSYPWHNKDSHRFWDKWSKNFDRMAAQLRDAGVTVVNYVGTPESKINVFDKAPLADV